MKEGTKSNQENPLKIMNATRALTYDFAVSIECRGTWRTSSISDSHLLIE